METTPHESATLEPERASVQAPRLARASVLGWAFGLAIVLALVLRLVVVVELARAQREVGEVFEVGNRTNSLIARVRIGVSRQRTIALEALTEAGVGFPVERAQAQQTRELVDTIDARMDGACTELARLSVGALEEGWLRFLPELDQLRDSLNEAFLALEAGDLATAEDVLDEAAAQSIAVHRALGELSAQNDARSEALQHAAKARLAGVMKLELALGLGFAVALAGIGVAASRLLAAQRRASEAYLARVEAANRELDQFAGRVAHDLRNVLAPVDLAGHLLGHREVTREALDRTAQRLRRTSQRATELIDSLLAFSRSGAAATPGAVADVAGVVEEARLAFGDRAAAAECSFVASAEAAQVACDRVLLGQALANLLDNAFKHMNGRPERRVAIRGRRLGSCYALAVHDSGPGIDPAFQSRLFDPFFRAPDSPGRGLGIGLATVQRIAEAHGGSVRCTSTLGGGATFTLVLPLVPASLAARPAEPAAAR